MMAEQRGHPPRILVVDDEAMIALLLEDILVACGCQVVGPATNVATAMSLIQAGNDRAIDGAFLDVNLRGELIYPVVDVLVARDVPVVFVSGYAGCEIDPRYAAIPALAKPVPIARIEHYVTEFADRHRT
ncbi:MAG TPA: response regulator [Rhodopila sp.]|jgi:two-component SAPR family response regulator